jgi:Icc-related predicted phosphoesterase
VELDPGVPDIQSLHARRLQHGPVSFVGYQYSLPFMGGVFEKSEAEISSDLVAMAPLLDRTAVFVTHSPAFGVLDPGIGDVPVGSRSLHALLESRPCRAHVHGHSHAGFGRWGNRFNVAAGGRHRAVVLDLETMQHRILGPSASVDV